MKYLIMVLTFVFLMGSIAFALLPGEVGEYDFDANPNFAPAPTELEKDAMIALLEAEKAAQVNMLNTSNYTVKAIYDSWGYAGRYCNGPYDPIHISISAEVAQWVEICLFGTNIKWKIYKPSDCGWFYAYPSWGLISSNGNVGLLLTDIEDLSRLDDEPDIIVSQYQLCFAGLGGSGSSDWSNSDKLPLFITEDQLHTPYLFWLNNRIKVVRCDSSCCYSDPDGINLKIFALEQKPWVCGYGDRDNNGVQDAIQEWMDAQPPKPV